MGTEILKTFGTLQSELEQAKSSLRGVDENIKRLIGRDPSDFPLQRHLKRPQQSVQDTRNAKVTGARKVYSYDSDEPPTKKKSGVFSRLSDRVYDDEFEGVKSGRGVISKVIVTPREVPSRQDALDAQSKDEKAKARNRRMFGALLGTLQKFQQEETKLKPIEDKRAQVEKKIEETENREKAEIKKERKELFFNRKKKQAEIKMIELKMIRMREYAKWEELQKNRAHFIKTKTKPHIYYMPRKMNESNKKALQDSKNEIEKMIEEKKQEVSDELLQIEERMKRNFEPKSESQKDEDAGNDDNEQNGNDESIMDEDNHDLGFESHEDKVITNNETFEVDISKIELPDSQNNIKVEEKTE